MIDAIYIQTCSKELEDGRFAFFCAKFFNEHNFNNIVVPIYIFTDLKSFNNLNYQNMMISVKSLAKTLNLDIKYIFIDDSTVFNKTTYILQFLLNFEVEKFKKILLLETDCNIKPDFLNILNRDIESIHNDDWFIYGSKYYGDVIKKQKTFERSHMNGVAVYNRRKNWIDFLNQQFNENFAINIPMNYDFFLFLCLSKYNLYENSCIDSNFILNISAECDTQKDYLQIKPNSVIVHQKKIIY